MILTNDNIPMYFKGLKKAASFSDIHFGKKNNSEQHNQDCLNSIGWFCDQVRNDPTIDHVIIMGDWHDLRASLNILTMDYSYRGAEMLGELGIPIVLLIGNHDLFHRQTRSVYSTMMFKHIPNFHIVPEPVVVKMANGEVLLAPYLFPEEYPGLVKYKKVPVWWGHFEFKGFVVSGYNIKMQHGPEHSDFKGPKKIFSGHFHQRQITDNIVYIGNTFPMDFSDAGDFERGLAVYEYKTDDLSFIDWADCPKYVKAKLSALLDESIVIPSNARVKCIVDMPITYEESLVVKQTYMGQMNLRELNLEESGELDSVLSDTAGVEIERDGAALSTVDELVLRMLGNIDTDKIDKHVLIDIYRKLKTD